MLTLIEGADYLNIVSDLYIFFMVSLKILDCARPCLSQVAVKNLMSW